MTSRALLVLEVLSRTASACVEFRATRRARYVLIRKPSPLYNYVFDCLAYRVHCWLHLFVTYVMSRYCCDGPESMVLLVTHCCYNAVCVKDTLEL